MLRPSLRQQPAPMDSDFPHLPRRTLRLDNGVQVALLHDARASRVALAAGVAAGSFHEPPQWPGLAHFLEHSLFLGSVAQPGVGAFADYVHGHGGRYNARTLGRQTLYYLEVPARELAPALERLVDLLARPLLLEGRLQAEREVLDAEYRARCQDADSQLHGALAGLLQPGHPLTRFHAGLLGNDTRCQLLGRHFQREEADDAAVGRHGVAVGAHFASPALGDVVADIGGEGGFAHARPAGEDDEVRGLQAAHHAVEIVEARRCAGKLTVALKSVGGHVDGGSKGLGEALKTSIVPTGLGQFVEPSLGVFDLIAWRKVDRCVVRDVDHVLADLD